MSNRMGFVKATVVGGLVFLVPLVIVIAVLGKAFQVMLLLAKPLGALIRIDSVGDIAVVNLLAVVILVVLCFLAGLAAKSSLGKSTFQVLDAKLLMLFPGYAFVKGFSDTAVGENDQQALIPILAKLDDATHLAFEVDRTDRDLVVVFLPGSPNPWSGNVAYMTPDRVERLDMSLPEAVKCLRRLGRGTSLPPAKKASDE